MTTNENELKSNVKLTPLKEKQIERTFCKFSDCARFRVSHIDIPIRFRESWQLYRWEQRQSSITGQSAGHNL